MNFTRINGTIINLDLVRQFYAIHQNPRNPFHSSLVFVGLPKRRLQGKRAARIAKSKWTPKHFAMNFTATSELAQ